MLVFSIEVCYTGSGYHSTFGIRKLKKAKRRPSQYFSVTISIIQFLQILVSGKLCCQFSYVVYLFSI